MSRLARPLHRRALAPRFRVHRGHAGVQRRPVQPGAMLRRIVRHGRRLLRRNRVLDRWSLHSRVVRGLRRARLPRRLRGVPSDLRRTRALRSGLHERFGVRSRCALLRVRGGRSTLRSEPLRGRVRPLRRGRVRVRRGPLRRELSPRGRCRQPRRGRWLVPRLLPAVPGRRRLLPGHLLRGERDGRPLLLSGRVPHLYVRVHLHVPRMIRGRRRSRVL